MKRRLKLHVLKRPICWVFGHRPKRVQGVAFISEHGTMPPHSHCTRCGMPNPPRRPGRAIEGMGGLDS